MKETEAGTGFGFFLPDPALIAQCRCRASSVLIKRQHACLYGDWHACSITVGQLD
ncbi:hypothetical protein [Pseudomonas plecoglossicida]|uniref:hypothetical protein n=1 Tax=Pseudomonas plecoglossicida TaxID=70775 RepID=UPI0015E46525|nr:hypothetical protein [Pseudomonas plecoglossicida]MBA1321365.1 hypothetical protein [Pseudomonas plecoglossicida]